MHMRRHLGRRRLLALSLATAAAPLAQADDRWPRRPIRLILAYPPGGINDAVARAVADHLSARIDRPVLLEHRPGGGGAVALGVLGQSAADGHTLCLCAIAPITMPADAGWSPPAPRADVVPVVAAVSTPALVVGTRHVAGHSLAEVVRDSIERGTSLRWATSGVGSTGHLILEQVRLASGADIVHVPYKAGEQQIKDALAAEFEILSTNVAPTQLGHVRDRKLQALAVGWPSRVEALPHVATLSEQGFARANLPSTFGFFAAPGTPQPLVVRIAAEIDRALSAAALRSKLEAAGHVVIGGSPDHFAMLIAREQAAHVGLHWPNR